jgi:hypothetical protein
MSIWKWIWRQLLTRPGRMWIAGMAFMVGGWLIYSLGPKGLGVGIGAPGLLLFLVCPLIWLFQAINSVLPKETKTGVMVAIATTIVTVFLVLPYLLLALASPGSTWKVIEAEIHGTGGSGGIAADVAGIAELVCLLLSPALLIVFPEILHRRLPWRSATALARTLLPAWLATAAAVSTWLYIVLQNTADGALVGIPTVPLMVAALGAAALLAPAYRRLARSCWKSGVAAVFDPKRWRSTCCTVFGEVMSALFIDHAAQAAGDETDPGHAAAGS